MRFSCWLRSFTPTILIKIGRFLDLKKDLIKKLYLFLDFKEIPFLEVVIIFIKTSGLQSFFTKYKD